MEEMLARAGEEPERDTAACFVLAMAQHQLRQTDNARVSLGKGREILNAKMPTLTGGHLGDNWDDWVTAHALLREAKALIEDQPARPKQ
jgi:hypothetical protein